MQQLFCPVSMVMNATAIYLLDGHGVSFKTRQLRAVKYRVMVCLSPAVCKLGKTKVLECKMASSDCPFVNFYVASCRNTSGSTANNNDDDNNNTCNNNNNNNNNNNKLFCLKRHFNIEALLTVLIQ